MTTRRKGLGKNKGQGYKNLIKGYDKKVHEDSGRGMKQPLKVGSIVKSRRTDVLGIVTKTSPFAVKVKLPSGKITQRLSNPKFWKVTKSKSDLKDTDKDGVPDKVDCQPKNYKMQDDVVVEDIDDFEDRVTTEKKPSFFSKVGSKVKKVAVDGYEWNKKHQEDNAKFKEEIASLSNTELYSLALTWSDDSLLFSSDNPYEEELVKRVRRGNKLDERIKKIQKEPVEEESKGLFDF